MRDGKAEHFQNAKEQMAQEGRENLRMLIDQLRSRLEKTPTVNDLRTDLYDHS